MVDDEDYGRVAGFDWGVAKVRGVPRYARATVEVGKPQVYLHRFILGAAPGTQVDHKNGDGFDCRRENLRTCSHRDNQRNRSTWGSSRFNGVAIANRPRPGWPKWRAHIKTDQRRVHLGYFATEEEAARAYDTAAREHYGAFARLNFPEAQAVAS